jgi:hypothetical protein
MNGARSSALWKQPTAAADLATEPLRKRDYLICYTMDLLMPLDHVQLRVDLQFCPL